MRSWRMLATPVARGGWGGLLFAGRDHMYICNHMYIYIYLSLSFACVAQKDPWSGLERLQWTFITGRRTPSLYWHHWKKLLVLGLWKCCCPHPSLHYFQLNSNETTAHSRHTWKGTQLRLSQKVLRNESSHTRPLPANKTTGCELCSSSHAKRPSWHLLWPCKGM